MNQKLGTGAALLLLLLVLPPPVYGQSGGVDANSAGMIADKRVERWRQKRMMRLSQVQPLRRSKTASFLLWLEEQLSEPQAPPDVNEIERFLGLENSGMSGVLGLDYRDQLFPRAGSTRTGSGFGAGLRYWNPRLLGSSLDLEFSAEATLNRYQFYNLRLGKLQLGPEVAPSLAGLSRIERPEFFLYSDLRYGYFPQEDFFGLGPNSRKSDRTDFLLERASYSVIGGLRLNPHLTAAARAGISQIDVGAGRDARFPNTQALFREEGAPGLEQQPNFLELASSILLDYRDVPGNPHKGVFFGFSFERFDDLSEERFKFNRFVFDGRAYLPLGSVQRTLALQFLTSLDDESGEATVPFYLQRTLGGKSTLRGFSDHRFRDRNSLHFSAEYRWEAASALELAIFYDTGKVFADHSDFSLDGLRQSVGGGVRFKTAQAAFLRLDVARSGEETRFHFTVGHPF